VCSQKIFTSRKIKPSLSTTNFEGRMIPFSPPRIDDETIKEVTDTLLSGWITTGPKTKRFEKELGAYFGCPNVICVSSATAGLELMLRWFGVQEGDEVIVPAYTYCASANVIVHCGATPVMVDVNENDFNASIANIEKAITSRTKVIIPVDIAGFPCDYDQLNALVKRNDIVSKFTSRTAEQEKLGRVLVLSDAAHSIGATVNGNRTGSLTDVSVFSFHAVKNLTTAEGGAIAMNLPQPFDNEALYKQFCIKILHGQTKDALSKTQGNWRYDVTEAGYKCNMTDIQAAIGLVELNRYDETTQRRKQIFAAYTEGFSKHSWAHIPPYQTEEKESSYHLYLLRIKGIDEPTRDQIIEEIFAQGVSVNVHFMPLPMLTVYKNKGYDIADYPTAFTNYSAVITLPVYFNLSDENVQTVIEAVEHAVQKIIG
jgi:dTDP-4-amino-4,6-dideoxygalactose transaminase